MITHARENQPLPAYGDGLHERHWLYVEDYRRAIELVLERGQRGEGYNVSAGSPLPNLEVVRTILQLLGESDSLIRFVEDRPGHDRRYALNSTKIRQKLGWQPEVTFEEERDTKNDCVVSRKRALARAHTLRKIPAILQAPLYPSL